MTIGFFRPVGTVADVNELEYISALAQTDTKQVRSNGSLTAEDIQFFLLSRYGIDVDEQEVKSKIIRGLGGGDEEEDDTIDLMEIVATLLIPTLLKATAEDVPKECVAPRGNLIRFVLDMILHDLCGTTEPPELTTDLIKKILTMYGESELAENEELLLEMLESAQSNDGGKVLDENTFISGLTSDIQLYDPVCEIRQTTNAEDVFLAKSEEEEDDILNITNDQYTQRMNTARKSLKRKKVMLAALDTTAGTYRSKILLVSLWVMFITIYFGFIHPHMKSEDTCTSIPYGTTWSGASEYMICSLIAKIIIWLFIFLISSIWGTLIIGAGSIGNTDSVRSFLIPLIGIACLAIVVFTPEPVSEAIDEDNTVELRAQEEYLGTIAYVLFGIVALIHIRHAIILVLPSSKMNYRSGSVIHSSHMKKAGAFKINKMVENAMKLASEKHKESVIVTHFGQGLQNFSKQENQLEWSSGFIETARKILSGKFIYQEGIWISARIIGSNIGQFIVIVFVLIAGYSLSENIRENYTVEDAKAATSEYIGVLFDRQISDEQVQSLLINTSASLTGFLATTASSGVFQQYCQGLPTSSLFDLATSACSHSDSGLPFPSCSNLTSREDYLCSIAQSYEDAAAISNDTTGCCSWGDGCGGDEVCNGSKETCETLCLGTFLQVEKEENDSNEKFTDNTGGCCSWGDGGCGSEIWCNANRANCEGVCEGTYIKVAETIYQDRASEQFRDAIGGETEALYNMGLLQASGLDIESLIAVARTNLQSAAESSVDSLYPSEEWVVHTPVLIGTIVASLTALSLAVTYIPSVASTTLKLRSGVIPSLRDPEFNRYRVAADQVTIITGSLFWGSLIASILMGSLVGVFVFLFLWQASIPIVVQLLSLIIGISVVILIKLSLVLCCRCAFYKGFYRRRPAAVNIVNLALECANFAISAGFVIIRMIKLLLTAALYVGRIDTPFLAPGVGRAGNLELDNYPRIFLKEILSHEAHRHPYIDLLGVIYLMKLRHGDDFGDRSGATWRLIFVYSLMPWMHKYRIHDILEEQQKTFVTKKRNTTSDDKGEEQNVLKFPITSTLNLRDSNVNDSKLVALEAENANLKAQIARLEASRNVHYGDDDDDNVEVAV